MRTIPKSKKGGIVGNTVFGVASLVIVTILIYVVIQTVDNSSIVTQYDTITTTNETGAWLNTTTYTVSNSGDSGFQTLTITEAFNATDNVSIATGNFTVSGAGFTNASATNWADVIVSYTYQRYTTEQDSVEGLKANFTTGIGDVGDKIPTILLIVAVVFLFGALVILMRQAKSAGMGGSSSL